MSAAQCPPPPSRAAAPAPAPRQRGDLAEAMVPLAARLAGAVHDRDPAAVACLLGKVPAGAKDALAVVLAAMVDVDQSPRDLLAWVRWDERGQPRPAPGAGASGRRGPRSLKPCGTPAAYTRHRRRGEQPCQACKRAHADHAAQRARERGTRPGDEAAPRRPQAPASPLPDHRHPSDS
jgi:hypothetical protein